MQVLPVRGDSGGPRGAPDPRRVPRPPALVCGLAIPRAKEAAAVRASGLHLDQWWTAQGDGFTEVVATDGLSELVFLRQEASADFDALFEHGLARHLDGLAVLLRRNR